MQENSSPSHIEGIDEDDKARGDNSDIELIISPNIVVGAAILIRAMDTQYLACPSVGVVRGIISSAQYNSMYRQVIDVYASLSDRLSGRIPSVREFKLIMKGGDIVYEESDLDAMEFLDRVRGRKVVGGAKDILREVHKGATLYIVEENDIGVRIQYMVDVVASKYRTESRGYPGILYTDIIIPTPIESRLVRGPLYLFRGTLHLPLDKSSNGLPEPHKFTPVNKRDLPIYLFSGIKTWRISRDKYIVINVVFNVIYNVIVP